MTKTIPQLPLASIIPASAPIETVVSGTISAFSDNGSGGTIVTIAGGNTSPDGSSTVITGTTNYNGTFTTSNEAPGVSFDINTPFTFDDATGVFSASVRTTAQDVADFGGGGGGTSVSITTGASPTTLSPTDTLSFLTVHVTTGGTAGFEDVIVPLLTLTNGSNAPANGSVLTVVLDVQTDPGDIVRVGVGSIVAIEGGLFLNATFATDSNAVQLNTVGQTAVFQWIDYQWVWNDISVNNAANFTISTTQVNELAATVAYGLSQISDNLAGSTLLPANNGYWWENSTGSLVTKNLPAANISAQNSLFWYFLVNGTGGIKLQANGTDVIWFGDEASAPGGYIQSTTQGAYFLLTSNGVDGWFASPVALYWTLDGGTPLSGVSGAFDATDFASKTFTFTDGVLTDVT